MVRQIWRTLTVFGITYKGVWSLENLECVKIHDHIHGNVNTSEHSCSSLYSTPSNPKRQSREEFIET